MKYPHRPVKSMNALALALGVSKNRLGDWERRQPEYYALHNRLNAAEGPSSQKIWYAPHPELKRLHRLLNKAFLNRVELPPYIVGGVIGRSYADACSMHAKSKTVIQLDIKAFYESVTQQDVLRIWRTLLAFAPDVADWLAIMTTFQGRLPRGAPASTALANLVFFDREPDVARVLARHGLRYSRYIDDIAVSSARSLKPAEVRQAIAQVQSILKPSMALNDKKTAVLRAPAALTVHKVNVDRDPPTVPKGRRRDIRFRVHRLKREADARGVDEALSLELESIRGTLAWLSQFHPIEAAAHVESLRNLS